MNALLDYQVECVHLCAKLGLSATERDNLVLALYCVPWLSVLDAADCAMFVEFLKRAKVVRSE